jgi:hypothetical protein
LSERSPRFTGGCLCGAVRIEIAVAPYRVGICHCLDCRKRQGAIFSSFAVFPAAAVQVSGKTREFKTRSFCPACGSPLFDRFGDELELQIGCLDEPNQLVPTYESWMVRREAWLPPFDLANHYERDRLTKGRSDP